MSISFEVRDLCPLCRAENSSTLCSIPYSDKRLTAFLSEFYARRIDTATLASGEYRIKQCDSCGFIYQEQVLNEAGGAALYGEWIDNQSSLQKKQTAKARLFRQYSGQLETLSRLVPRPPGTVKVLEFGMGWGYWSRMAQAFGYDVVGMELAPERVAHAQSMGINVSNELLSNDQCYDYIHANQVFEHLSDPVGVLSQLVTKLEDRGIIYLRVPDGRDIKGKLATGSWPPELNAIHPLEHINCFTRNTLRTLAAEAGLRPLSPPLRANIANLWGGLKREFMDRFITTHIYFERR